MTESKNYLVICADCDSLYYKLVYNRCPNCHSMKEPLQFTRENFVMLNFKLAYDSKTKH